MSRYERLVGDVESANAATAPDMQARVRMANRELSLLAVQLQQLLVEKHEAAESTYAAQRGLDEAAEAPFGMVRSAASA